MSKQARRSEQSSTRRAATKRKASVTSKKKTSKSTKPKPSPHSPRLGVQARKSRLKEAETRITMAVLADNPRIDEEELIEQVDEALLKLVQTNPTVRRLWRAFAPTSRAPDRKGIDLYAEFAAAFKQPEMAQLRKLILEGVEPGQRAARELAFNVLLLMAKHPEARTLRHTRTRLLETPRAQLALGEFAPAPESSLYEHAHVLANWCHPAHALRANIAMLKRLAAEHHHDIGRVACVDGTDIEANVLQRSLNDEPELRELLYGRRLRKVRAQTYSGDDHHLRKFWAGYKLMGLTDLASGLPIVWHLFPANVGERGATLELLAALFELWPDCPLEYLIGDGLYSEEIDFLHALEFKWAVHPVVPLDSNIALAMRWSETKGVPSCEHGLMKRHAHDNYYSPQRRAKEGIARGQLVPDDARIIYHCVVETCPHQYVYTRDDGRLYPYLPYDCWEGAGGKRDKAWARRVALEHRRGSIESGWANLKHAQIGGSGATKFKVSSDNLQALVIDLYASMTTAIRKAHESGDYAETRDALDEAEGRDIDAEDDALGGFAA